jgi:hypothetical protein
VIPDDLYEPILAVGIDPAPSADSGMVVMPGVHKAQPISTGCPYPVDTPASRP